MSSVSTDADTKSGFGSRLRGMLSDIGACSRRLSKEPEVRLILCFLPLLLIGRLLSGQFVFPGSSDNINIVQNYIDPVLIAIVIMFFMLRKMDYLSTFLMLALMLFSLFFMCNFKSWALLTGRNYDALFQAVDLRLGIAAWMVWLQHALVWPRPWFVMWFYYPLFVVLFIVTMVMMTLRRKIRGAREANFSMCLLMMVGGISYCFFPAYGPFLYRSGLMPAAQQVMQSDCDLVKATGHFPAGFFAEALGAMPSMHLAFSTLFICLSWKYYRRLLPLFILSFAYFFMESMGSGWHYFVDLPAGMLLGVLCFYFGGRISGFDRQA